MSEQRGLGANSMYVWNTTIAGANDNYVRSNANLPGPDSSLSLLLLLSYVLQRLFSSLLSMIVDSKVSLAIRAFGTVASLKRFDLRTSAA